MAKGQDAAGMQQVADGPEFRLLGNLFGVMIASAGLLAGTMMRERSFDYWLEDIVPLMILAITLRGLLLNAISLFQSSMAYDEKMEMLNKVLAQQPGQSVVPDLELPLLTKKREYSEEEVLEAVSKRIQEKTHHK